MKVVCDYCGSYVEADENEKCPLCNASLGSSVQSEQSRVEAQEAEAHQRESEERAQEAKDNHISEVISGVASVATAFAASAGFSNALGKSQGDSDDERRPLRPPDDRHGRFADGDDYRGKPDRHGDEGFPMRSAGHDGFDVHDGFAEPFGRGDGMRRPDRGAHGGPGARR